jgi:hypothetical protein
MNKHLGLSLGLLLFNTTAFAQPRIAVLAFELNDITSLPNTPQEQARTAAMQPLLEQALKKAGGYDIVHIPVPSQAQSNGSFGYLFRFHEVAAQLGRQYGADWVVVGQHSKPSFLYSYLLVHLINVKHQHLSANFAIEQKGSHISVTEHGMAALADKLSKVLNRPD